MKGEMICQTLSSRCLCTVREKPTKKLRQVRRNLLQYQNRSNTRSPILHQLADHRQSNCPLPHSQQSHKHITYSCKTLWPRSHLSQLYIKLRHQTQCHQLGTINRHRCMCRTRCTRRNRRHPKSRNALYQYKSSNHPSKRRLQLPVSHHHRTTVQDHSTIPFNRRLQLDIQVLTVASQHRPQCSPTQTTSSTRAITTSTIHQRPLNIPCINNITSTINSSRLRCNNSSNISK